MCIVLFFFLSFIFILALKINMSSWRSAAYSWRPLCSFELFFSLWHFSPLLKKRRFVCVCVCRWHHMILSLYTETRLLLPLYLIYILRESFSVLDSLKLNSHTKSCLLFSNIYCNIADYNCIMLLLLFPMFPLL